MSQVVLQAETRTPGQALAKQLRRDERVPGVYYAKGQEPVHFSVSYLALRPIVHTARAKTVKLEVAGKDFLCVLQDVSFDPLSDKILHVDLLGVKAGEKILVQIPVHLSGLAQGVREGGTLEHTMHKAHVRVDPTEMPEVIEVDVTNLARGSAIHVSDLSVAGVEFLDRATSVVVACHAPKVVAAAVESAPAKKGKK